MSSSEGMSLKQQIALVIGNAKLIALVNSRFSPSIFADEILRLVAEKVERMPLLTEDQFEQIKGYFIFLDECNHTDVLEAQRANIVTELRKGG